MPPGDMCCNDFNVADLLTHKFIPVRRCVNKGIRALKIKWVIILFPDQMCLKILESPIYCNTGSN